ncbi:hypothetical protein P2G88_18675 [Aliiglaciecola sp. CAU 1673]|uniref:DUF4386 family protein n=1 Tax=Aliiglaciecola sp. CAU 1673 TaxID=3032595 RepID=UPI0023DA6D5D|nr:DUF4386 family protein [Aliiglaciecola sp. CAU 1673]MDF2180286.1 hypothetical protein [Aliiglaciecola sp. CAU 1673]
MNPANPGKLIGGLFLLQLVGGIFLNFFFLAPFKTDYASVDVAVLTSTLGIATLLSLGLVSINLLVGAIAYQMLKTSYPVHSLLLLAVSILAVGMTAVESNELGQYVSLVTHLKAQGIQELDAGMEILRKSLAFSRNEAHFMAIALSSFSLLLLYTLLYRATHLSRWLMGFAIGACVLQLIALGNTLFQGPVLVMLQLPLVLTQLVLPLVFVFKGLALTNDSDVKEKP